MRTKRFHGLKRIKIRQTWNKYNLYNLFRLKDLNIRSNTHYQQKWAAKSATRAYHGEQIREKQWERMFTSRIRSVIPMNPQYLAAFDGSEQAEGRGSGKELRTVENRVSRIPYMHMTFAPSERRLDTAIFRALFASSARQARQFVIHGHVKVNGKKMIYPGYLLNPGDMFQVEPDRVMFATGAPKDTKQRRATRLLKKRQDAKKNQEEAAEADEALPFEDDAAAISTTTETATEALSEDEVTAKRKAHKANLKSLLEKAKAILHDDNDKPSAKRKQNLRAFTSSVRRSLSGISRTAAGNLDSQFQALASELASSIAVKPPTTPQSNSSSATPTASSSSSSSSSSESLSRHERQRLIQLMRDAIENPYDPSKSYATPWKPRSYMAPFAFIPRYLEVNQNICSAVYLRHPVARPGLAEVPSPFPQDTQQLAFNWYLRRR